MKTYLLKYQQFNEGVEVPVEYEEEFDTQEELNERIEELFMSGEKIKFI